MRLIDIAVIIPTRNRAKLAINAIRSILEEAEGSVQVMVSDNSVANEDLEELAAFCSAHAVENLRYVRPPQPLSMTLHWEWAIQEACRFYQASHFTFLTDRMVFRSGALKEILRLADLYPEKVISYNMDRIVDHVRPVRVEEAPATGKLLEIDTDHLSRLVSQGIFHPGLPRMLNCLAPRKLIDRIQQRFGNVFSSIAPDFNFCCRCLDLENSVLFHDESALIHYGLDRSHGACATRGELSADVADFMANLPVDNSVRNYATPIPQLITAANAAFNEYLLFKQQTNSSRFYEVDMQKYLDINAEEIKEVVDPPLRAQMFSLLTAKGYRKHPAGNNGQNGQAKSSILWERVRWKLRRLATSPATTNAWIFAARTFGIRPPRENRFEFATQEEAINYARNISSGNLRPKRPLDPLLKARELPKQ